MSIYFISNLLSVLLPITGLLFTISQTVRQCFDIQTVALQQAGLCQQALGGWCGVEAVQCGRGVAVETGQAGEVSVRLAGQQD